MKILLDGYSLSLVDLARIAGSEDTEIILSVDGKERMQEGREIVLSALERSEVIYGLTTGLGSQAGEGLSGEQLSRFSVQTLRGRAQSLGEPLAKHIVRAAMAVRINTLMTGAAGASPELADCLLACLRTDTTPIIGEIGSIGVADLCWGATLGLALTGEGKMRNSSGEICDATEALASANVPPFKPGPKDGLVIASHSSFSGALLALSGISCGYVMEAVQAATIITMEAMRANLTPLDPIASALHPQHLQAETALQLLDGLAGSALKNANQAKRLQDPLSMRNAVHVHAAAFSALENLKTVATIEINSVTDNPIVDLAGCRVLSCGTYYTAHLALVAQSMSQALAHVATAQLARMSKLLSARFSGLPQFLASGGVESNGFAPVLKIAEALVAGVHHDATPATVWPSINAEGVEDIQSHAPLAIRSLGRVLDQISQLCAMELIMGAQAIDMLKGVQKAPQVLRWVEQIRLDSAPIQADRSITDDINLISDAIRRGKFRCEKTIS